MEPVSTTDNREIIHNPDKKGFSYKKIQEFIAGSQNISKASTSKGWSAYIFIESSTANIPYLSGFQEFRKILERSTVGVDEFEEEDIFAKHITRWIERYGFETLDTLSECYGANEINEKTMSHILMALGNANNYKTYRERLHILEEYLESSSSKIRYGAVIGISNLDDPKVLPALLRALDKESIPVLKGTMKSIIKQLRETANE